MGMKTADYSRACIRCHDLQPTFEGLCNACQKLAGWDKVERLAPTLAKVDKPTTGYFTTSTSPIRGLV